jgi:hypothetical protein
MLRWLVRGYVLDRLLRALTGPRGGGYPRQRAGGLPVRSGYPPQRRMTPGSRRGRFGGPIPHYSSTTRGGTRVTVGGCCLPIPLGLLAAGSALLARRLNRVGRA